MTQVLTPGAGAVPVGQAGPAVSPPNEVPLADAGLDQTVALGRTVLLDGRGSRDPDGSVRRYAWEVLTPSGTTMAPDCDDCPRTTFTPNETGTYEVRLVVEDDDGATATDTLYVHVVAGPGPTVSLSVPASIPVGNTTSVVAYVESGAADLDRIEWIIDGSVVETAPISGDRDQATLEPGFPSTGVATITARVYDEANRTGADSRPITVYTPTNATVPAGPGGADSFAEEYDPVVDGPQVVTGSRPLAATYRLGEAPPASAVETVTWFDGGGVRGNGSTIDVEWEPGDNRFFAVVAYSDGSDEVVRFRNGRSVVVADPEPSLGLSDLDASTSISGAFTAADDYGNLVEVTVTVGGQRVFHREAQRAGSRPTLGEVVDAEFDRIDVAPNESYDVVVRATDGRNQTAVLRRTVVSSGDLEVVRAGFVNAPVDSYHERLDPSRYTAHHVVEVRLNGNDPEDIEVNYPGLMEEMVSLVDGQRRVVQGDNSSILIHSYWGGQTPGRYALKYSIYSEEVEANSGISTFEVESSDPELVLTTETHGTEGRALNWGIRVNASRSFDPDHTPLEYSWVYGAEPSDNSPAVGEFQSRENGDLEVNDQNGGFSAQRCCFLQYFVPQIRSVEQLNEGPFNATDTVRFEVHSDEWATTKTSDYYELDFDYESDSRYVDIVDQRRVERELRNAVGDEVNFRRFQRRAIVEVQAAALHEDTEQPVIALFNEENPGRIRTNYTLPTVEVVNESTVETLRTNVSIESLAYRIWRQNGTRERTVTDRRELQTYLKEGFDVVDERTTTSSIQLERRTIREEPETVRIAFGTRDERQQFLRSNQEWHPAGRQTRTRVETETDHVWQPGRSGPGEFTGRTRVRTIPAQTRTLHEYETRVRRTRTVTETVQKTFETETGRRTRPVTVTREVTHWDESTYWAQVPRSPTDTHTGDTREVVVQPARETREYQFEISREQRVTEVRYFATRTTVETVEVWQQYRRVEDYSTAEKLSRRDDVRVGSVQEETYWVVERSGPTTETVQEYEDRSNVVETIAIVSGTTQEKEVDPVTGDINITDVGAFREEVRREGALGASQILSIIAGTEEGCRKEVTCE
ncbi:PKD domain-containing protein [Haloarchaeobius sp. HRN-SO-5]|uniref:PKD domain-containing protein n=1 Tax=Haloarchaeobius sp. HRN-SO-5 TaxID=3446118 RepID=UPI003EB966A1